MNITLLCKVVDNYGDIGFVYRLSRNLSQLSPESELRLVVSNLESFSRMNPQINPLLPEQCWNNWKILDWNNAEVCTKEFTENPPQIILECFQCGRPDWLEDILFDKDRTQTVQIVNVEYLTAEEWADDFHLLKSGTRSIFVKKINFMPGFTSKTGGLVLDKPFTDFINCQDKNLYLEYLTPYLSEKQIKALRDQDTFCVSVFTYQRDFASEAKALKLYENFMQQKNPDFKIHIFAAPGLSFSQVSESAEQNNISCSSFSYLPQSSWDCLMTMCDFNIIRGEDSFSRACLSPVPFIWHAYIQEDEFQLVKSDAILKRMEAFFDKTLFDTYKKYFLNFNITPGAEIDSHTIASEEALEKVLTYLSSNTTTPEEQTQLLFDLLKNYQELKISQANFSKSLYQNGNLTINLMNYLNSL